MEKTIPVDFRPEQPVFQMYANGSVPFRDPRFQLNREYRHKAWWANLNGSEKHRQNKQKWSICSQTCSCSKIFNLMYIEIRECNFKRK